MPESLAKLFKKKFKFVLDDKIRQFNTEVAFFARTFFFVYLGLVVSFENLNLLFLFGLVGIFCSILVSRYVVVEIATRFLYKSEEKFKGIYFSMVSRGLTSAVLVGMVQASIPGTKDFFGVRLCRDIINKCCHDSMGVPERNQTHAQS